MGIKRTNWKIMGCKKSGLILLIFFFHIACKPLLTDKMWILMKINNSKNISEEHLNVTPVWAKFSTSDRTLDQRGFMVYSDGTLYNYDKNTEDEETEWKNWGKIESKYILEIENNLKELHQIIPENTDTISLNDTNIAIQYTIDNSSYIGVISKDYNGRDGKYLKNINSIINNALAARSKK